MSSGIELEKMRAEFAKKKGGGDGGGGAAFGPPSSRGERPARPSGAASEKRPHSRRRRLSAELQNVGEAPRSSHPLELFFKMLHFGKFQKFRKNLVEFSKILAKFCEILKKSSKKFSIFC